MKTMFVIAACVALVHITLAQDTTSLKKNSTLPHHYCVVLKGSTPEVNYRGKIVKEELTLPNGNKITPTGTVIKKDGTIHVIKPGSCVNSSGNEVEHAVLERK
ncbi:MAG TPA: DUF6799 domain-containing protein [Chitinophagales bacterium]|nr:DUF6799 domain-containing protein [Chitinophagales bacterium]